MLRLLTFILEVLMVVFRMVFAVMVWSTDRLLTLTFIVFTTVFAFNELHTIEVFTFNELNEPSWSAINEPITFKSVMVTRCVISTKSLKIAFPLLVCLLTVN
jgi:hypothetical protein